MYKLFMENICPKAQNEVCHQPQWYLKENKQDKKR